MSGPNLSALKIQEMCGMPQNTGNDSPHLTWWKEIVIIGKVRLVYLFVLPVSDSMRCLQNTDRGLHITRKVLSFALVIVGMCMWLVIVQPPF